MTDYRKTYKDPEYLRDPVGAFEAIKRRDQDQKRAQYESAKQQLDMEKTQYMIDQSSAVAAAAEKGVGSRGPALAQ